MDRPRWRRDQVADEEGRPIHIRIRRRRDELDMTAVALAEEAGISPAYVSLIEKGEKIPTERVAIAIANALDDDADLYLAWAHSRRQGEFSSATDRYRRMARYSTPDFSADAADEADGEYGDEDVRSSMPLRLDSPEIQRSAEREHSPRLRAAASRTAGPARGGPTVPLLLLKDGADPALAPEDPRLVEDRIHLDPRFLPEEITPGPLFAYRPRKKMLRRVKGLIEPGDYVILSAGIGEVRFGRIYAVRMGRGKPKKRSGMALSRLLVKDNHLMLVPAEGGMDVEVVELGPAEDPMDRVAGEVVATIRHW